jgi:hypothetical protein
MAVADTLATLMFEIGRTLLAQQLLFRSGEILKLSFIHCRISQVE